MAHSERLVLLAAVVAVGLGLSLTTAPPLLWVLAATVVATAVVGSDQLIHAHWRAHRRRRRYDLTLWIFPALIVVGGFLVLRLPFFSTGPAVALGIGATTLFFVAVVVCQLHSLSADDPHYTVARFVLTLLAYLSAFGLYSAIYAPRVRSAYSATAVMLVTILICLELFRGQWVNGQRAGVYALVLGLTLGELTWALNYWLVTPLAGGLLLLVALYVGAGIVQSHMSGDLTRRTLAEFAGVASLAVGLVLGVGFLST